MEGLSRLKALGGEKISLCCIIGSREAVTSRWCAALLERELK